MSYEDLNEREKSVAKLITNGYSLKEIAKYHGTSIESIKWSYEQIKRKLGVNKNTQIAVIITKRDMYRKSNY